MAEPSQEPQLDDTALEPTKTIIAAFLTNHAVPAADVVALIQAVHRSLAEATTGVAEGSTSAEAPPVPAVPVRRSVTPDHLICLEDGKRFKSIRRHLQTAHGLDPVAYRARWGLKKDYPMVAPNYAEARSTLAKSIGLGQGGRKPAAGEPAPEVQPAKAPAKRARRPKATAPEA